MIPRHRLRGRGRFAAVRTGGVRASAGAVRVTVAPNGTDVARVGFALPGLRSAVVRNLLRRRLREAIRPLLLQLAGRDIVVVAGAGATHLPFAELNAALRGAVTRALERAESSPRASTADNADMTAARVQP